MNKKIIVVVIFLIVLGGFCMPRKSLTAYKKKRNFDTTSEPSGDTPPTQDSQNIFVIQKHDASHLHYDFRLEINGALKSWAVPKGPSTNPSIKRLAMETEDHPMGYAIFEGVIPEGNYGAGPVIVWDHGTFDNIKEPYSAKATKGEKATKDKDISLQKCYENGQIEVDLHGKKLNGGYALIRTPMDTDNKKKWLLIKMRDQYADARRNLINSQPESVISGKKIEELASKKKLKK
jgi:DNA ligase D-like protein (predicted 3'-phosphoesterase)